MTFLLSFTHAHVVPNLYDFVCFKPKWGSYKDCTGYSFPCTCNDWDHRGLMQLSTISHYSLKIKLPAVATSLTMHGTFCLRALFRLQSYSEYDIYSICIHMFTIFMFLMFTCYIYMGGNQNLRNQSITKLNWAIRLWHDSVIIRILNDSYWNIIVHVSVVSELNLRTESVWCIEQISERSNL